MLSRGQGAGIPIKDFVSKDKCKKKMSPFLEREQKISYIKKQLANLLSSVSCLQMERMTGIEPATPAWEAEVLPLNYIRGTNIIILLTGWLCQPEK